MGFCLPPYRYSKHDADMDGDPYVRLAADLWLLTPNDVAQLAELAERLVLLRVAALVGEAP